MPAHRSVAAFVAHAPLPLAAATGLLTSTLVPLLLVCATLLGPDAPAAPGLAPLLGLAVAAAALPLAPLALLSLGTTLAAHLWLASLARTDPRLGPAERALWPALLLIGGVGTAPLFYWQHLHRRAPSRVDPQAAWEHAPTLRHPIGRRR
jgi:hypothetical protein